MVTFKGVVTDSVNGMPIEGVLVNAGGGVTTTSNAKGEFTLSGPGTSIDFQSPVYFPALKWDPANGTFSWNGYRGDVSITVHNLTGNLVARGGSGKTSFSLSGLESGVYLIGVSTKAQISKYKINYQKHTAGRSYSIVAQNAAGLRKQSVSSADFSLTFTKDNFNPLTLPVAASGAGAIEAKMKSPYPLKNILKLFQDPSIPAQGPGEMGTTKDCGGNAEPDQTLIGGQLKMHNFIMIGENHRRINLVLDGKVAWEYDTKDSWEDDEVWVLSNGNVLHAHMTYIEELSPKKEVVWRFDNPSGTEIHTCQPIGVDKVLWLQNETGGSVVKLYNKKTKTYEIDKKMLEYGGNVHTQCRRLRMKANGNFIFGSMSKKTIAEYDKDLKLIKSFDAGSLWGAVPLKNGNYLLQREGLKEAAELDKDGKVVWSVTVAEIWPQVLQLAPGSVAVSATQTSERLSNGNTVIFTRYCTANLPQAIEVTPDKKVVWILRDQKNLGDAVSMQFLDEPGYPELPGDTNH